MYMKNGKNNKIEKANLQQILSLILLEYVMNTWISHFWLYLFNFCLFLCKRSIKDLVK